MRRCIDIGPGQSLHIPRGIVHGPTNDTSETTVCLAVLTPGALIRGVIVQCRRPGCGNRRRLSFDDLGLPDAMVFVEIGDRRRFRCYKCRGREVLISADWPKPKMELL